MRRSTFILSPTLWCELERVLRQSCLPNLRSLIKHDIASCTVEPMRLFLCDNLRHLEYNFYNLDRHDPTSGTGNNITESAERCLSGLFTGVAHCTSDVRVFHLMLPPFISPARRAELFLEAVPTLASVVSFQLPNLIPTPPSALSHLAGFAHLHSLAININTEDYPDGSPDIPDQSFPALRILKITSDSTSWCTAFISQVNSRHVITISLSINTTTTSDDFFALASALSHRPFAGVVRTLSLFFYPSPDGLSTLLPPVVFAPLHSLRALQEINLDTGCYVALDDDALSAMVQSWPSLRRAYLCQTSTGASSSLPKITLTGLVSVMNHCKHLEHLKVALENIDEGEIASLLACKPPRIFDRVPGASDPATDAQLERTPFCPLSKLGVGPSTITNAHIGGVAAVLSQWFPLLYSIDYCSRHSWWEIEHGIRRDGTPLDPHSIDSHNRWLEVARMVGAMALVRGQEQRWKLVEGCSRAPGSAPDTENDG